MIALGVVLVRRRIVRLARPPSRDRDRREHRDPDRAFARARRLGWTADDVAQRSDARARALRESSSVALLHVLSTWCLRAMRDEERLAAAIATSGIALAIALVPATFIWIAFPAPNVSLPGPIGSRRSLRWRSRSHARPTRCHRARDRRVLVRGATRVGGELAVICVAESIRFRSPPRLLRVRAMQTRTLSSICSVVLLSVACGGGSASVDGGGRGVATEAGSGSNASVPVSCQMRSSKSTSNECDDQEQGLRRRPRVPEAQ